jgi:serine protease Do
MKRPVALLCRCMWLPVVAGLLLCCGTAQGQKERRLPGPLLDAFQDVVRIPAKSTVQVYCDGVRSALGAIVRADGHIVTKESELKGKIQIQFSNETQRRDAKIVARDPATDLAVLKVEAQDLPVVPWSTGEMPAVGSWLATPGPVSKDPLSIGVVSVAARKLSPNAALGIRLGGDDGVARITEVVTGLAAEKAGLKVDDIIRKMDGVEIKGIPQLQQDIRDHYPGDKVTLLVEREGKLQTVEATLGSLGELEHDERSDFQNRLGGTLSERRTGFPLAIQHDSVLRPSECGGPIVDLDGKVVGLNIARAGRVESYALPAAIVRETVDRLLKTELTSTPSAEKPVSRKSGQER